ncbi:hypothetical protein HY008_01615, partial [Candidatus Woesebacteria bacterium]|nr:hypothetical protein [Candidatus Woesebacteria bacterium]
MKRDTLIGLAILAIVGGVVFYTQRARKIPEITISPTPTPSIEGKVKGLFN